MKFYVHQLIDREVHTQYTIKIMAGIGQDCDRNRDAQAKSLVAGMILNGDIAKDDVKQICASYMGCRETIVMSNGGMARWVRK
jgi:hypothetical protein